MNGNGMSRRPVTLVLIAVALCAVAISLPIQVMVLYGHGPSEWMEILRKLTALNYLVMIGGLFTALLVYRGSPLTRRAAPLLFLAVAANNFFVGYFATDYSFATASLGTLAFAILLAPLYFGETRQILLHPERRWWRSKTRVRAQLPLFVGGPGTVKFSGATFDISETGAFLPLPIEILSLNGSVSVRLTLGEGRQIRCEARVVRRGEARGAYPAGIGLQFTDLDRGQRRELKRYLAVHGS